MVRSEETAQRLEIEWSMRKLPTAASDGYGRSTLPLGALFDQSQLPAADRTPRPAIVWFLSAEPNVKLEKKLWDDEAVGAASRFFECVKIFVEDIDSKADRDRYAKTVPTVVFLDAGGAETGRLSGQFAPADAYRQMAKAAGVYFKKSLGELVVKYSDFLKRFDKVEGKIKDAQDDVRENEDHLVKHPCDRAKSAIKEAKDELVGLRKDREKLLKEEKGILQVELKADPFAKPEGAARK